MKNLHLPPLLCLCAVALVISSCTLDKEPEIPTGFNNVEKPSFLTAEVTPDTGNKFLTIARLDNIGNLNILHYGWVWSENHDPTLQDSSLVSDKLTADSFENEITGLDTGKVYYLRPFVSTGCDTIYADSVLCSFLGVHFTINTDTEIFKGADVQFTNMTPGNCTYLWDFGDGTAISTEASPKHTFNQNTGDVTVLFTAKLSGCTVTQSMTLKIVPDPFEDYWVHIRSGSFMMGCEMAQNDPKCNEDEDEDPVHPVTVDSFVLGKTEITQRQWRIVLGLGLDDQPSDFKACGEDCPVESVSWKDINEEFLPALDRKTGRVHRLPTEAEWEFAARGGDTTRYAGSDSLSLVGWYDKNSNSTPHPVAAPGKSPNAYGLHDMSGNVFEWVEDYYHDKYHGAPQNGSAWLEPPGTNRVVRGGSWYNEAGSSRVANRGDFQPATQLNRIGFRLARSY